MTKVTVKIDGQVTYEYPPPLTSKYIGWRALHKAEGGYDKTPLTMPEVIPATNPLAIEVLEALQRLSYNLMLYFNKLITPNAWTGTHGYRTAFMNGTGFGDPNDKRRNYITGEGVGSPNPQYDKERICGGTFVRGNVSNGFLLLTPGVHGIDSTKPLPTVDEVIKNNWYFYAINYFAEGVSYFGQGKGGPVVMPIVLKHETAFPIGYFEKWESNELPDPLKYYRSM